MIKRGFIYASIFQCGRRICSVKSMEWYIVCGLVGLINACSCTSLFIINYCFELMVNYVVFLYCLRSVGSSTQI